MPTPQSPALTILTETLKEYRDRISVDGGSKILCMDAEIAKLLADMFKDISTPYGPTFTIATAGSATASSGHDLGQNISEEPLEGLMSKMDYFSHAITDVTNADGKSCMEIMKWAKYALQPKGIAVVVAMKTDGKGQDFSEKMQAQSKGRVKELADVLDFAGFERGKIRSMGKTAEVEGKTVEAEVVLAMKWDQLTA